MALNKQVLSGITPCNPTSSWSDMFSWGMIRDSDHFTVVYVDNLLVFGTKQWIMREKKELAGIFEMHDLGKAKWFLMMEITCDRVAHTITIDQWQYIRKILEHFGLEIHGLYQH